MNECFCHTPPVGYSESLCGPSFLFQGSSGTKPDIYCLHYLAKKESITAHLCYFRCQYVNYEFFRRLRLKQLLLHKLKEGVQKVFGTLDLFVSLLETEIKYPILQGGILPFWTPSISFESNCFQIIQDLSLQLFNFLVDIKFMNFTGIPFFSERTL